MSYSVTEIDMGDRDTGEYTYYGLSVNGSFFGVITYNYVNGNWGNSNSSMSGNPVNAELDDLIACADIFTSVDEFVREWDRKLNEPIDD